MIIPFRKDPLLPALLGMVARPLIARHHHDIPEYKPSTRDTKRFKGTKIRKKISKASRKRNWK